MTVSRTPRPIRIRLEGIGRDVFDWLQSTHLRKQFLSLLSRIRQKAKSIVYGVSIAYFTIRNGIRRTDLKFGQLMVRFAEAGFIWQAFSTLLSFLRQQSPAARRAIVGICRALAVKGGCAMFLADDRKLTGITESICLKLKALFEHSALSH